MISEMCNMNLGQTHCLCQSMSSWKHHNYRAPPSMRDTHHNIYITTLPANLQPNSKIRTHFKKQFVANKVEMLQLIMQWTFLQER
jgi:hypothetical protein